MPNAFQASPGQEFTVNGILRRYKEMYDAFLDERSLIPAGHYTELAFEELEQDMVGSVARIYEAVGLDGYAQVEPKLKAHVAAQQDYQKNKHPQIEEGLRKRIYSTWQRAFEEFGYPA
jgi:LPS sulfotransferase NodH